MSKAHNRSKIVNIFHKSSTRPLSGAEGGALSGAEGGALSGAEGAGGTATITTGGRESTKRPHFMI